MKGDAFFILIFKMVKRKIQLTLNSHKYHSDSDQKSLIRAKKAAKIVKPAQIREPT